MKVRLIFKNNDECRFELIHEENNLNNEFLIITMDGDRATKFRKELVVEFLQMCEQAKSYITWSILDDRISRFMNTKVHIL
jgi:hypothetical protein